MTFKYKFYTLFPARLSIMLLVSYIVIIFTTDCKSNRSEQSDARIHEIRGIYGSPDPFWDKGIRLDRLGVNAVFLNLQSINEKMMERAGNEGLKVFAEFPLLNGKNYVETHPEAWAIDDNGNKVEPATWFMGVCPTEPRFKEFRKAELRKLLKSFDLDGIWLDYVHWHAQFEDPEPVLPETCFCDRCIGTFQSEKYIEIPAGSTAEKAKWILAKHDEKWRDWRCSVIAGWVMEMRTIVKQERSDALLGIYHCPWNDEEFDGARRRILGLDYDMLVKNADVFSPMVYHGRMGKEVGWVEENTDWFCRRLDIEENSFPKVWPIVQAYDDPYPITPEEFEKVLRYGLAGKSTGVMMFTSRAVAESEQKTEIMKMVYSKPAF